MLLFLIGFLQLSALSAHSSDIYGFHAQACGRSETDAVAQISTEIGKIRSCSGGHPKQLGGWTCKKTKLSACSQVGWSCTTQYDCEGGIAMTIPPMPENAQEACLNLVQNLDSCVPSQCDVTFKSGGKTRYEIQKDTAFRCKFIQTIKADPEVLKAVLHLKTMAEAVEIAGKSQATTICDVLPEYLSDLKQNLKLFILGGKVTVSACAPTSPGKKVADQDLGCRMTKDGQSFYDFFDFGIVKGFCSKSYSSAQAAKGAD